MHACAVVRLAEPAHLRDAGEQGVAGADLRHVFSERQTHVDHEDAGGACGIPRRRRAIEQRGALVVRVAVEHTGLEIHQQQRGRHRERSSQIGARVEK